jgi:predicted dehydrogenase
MITCDTRGNADYRDYKNAILRDIVDRVVIATPPITHYAIAKYWIERHIPVLVEKPITDNSSDAYKLCKLAKIFKTKLMVGHTYLYSPVLAKLKERLNTGFFGDIEYIDVNWQNLGIFQRGGVVLDLAPHPLSIILHLLDMKFPKTITCDSYDHRIRGIKDTASISLDWGKVQANINLSWIYPQKNRTITIVGTHQMLVWDDTSPLDKLKLYDKSCKFHDDYNSFGTFQMSYKYGDTVNYKIESREPLLLEVEDFLSNNDQSISSPELGHMIVRIINRCR